MAIGTHGELVLKKISMQLCRLRSELSTLADVSEEISEVHESLLEIETKIDSMILDR